VASNVTRKGGGASMTLYFMYSNFIFIFYFIFFVF
jgi:hypothetical protein